MFGACLSSHGYEVEGLRIFTPLPVVSPLALPALFIQQILVLTHVMSLTHWMWAGVPEASCHGWGGRAPRSSSLLGEWTSRLLLIRNAVYSPLG